MVRVKSLLRRMPFMECVSSFIRHHFFSIYNHRVVPSREGVYYSPNEEVGTINLDIKLKRVADGGCFDSPDMIATNKAIGLKFLSTDIQSVVNIGSGVGTFEMINAPIYPKINFLASEMDVKSTEWAIENRSFHNVRYCAESMIEILKKENKFDLAVTIDVIEHVANYKQFLDEFAMLSDRAVISTPNRDRHRSQIIRPSFKFHVKEFDAGELYFILKMYYRKVELYSAPDELKTDLIPVGLYSSYDKLFAYCEK